RQVGQRGQDRTSRSEWCPKAQGRLWSVFCRRFKHCPTLSNYHWESRSPSPNGGPGTLGHWRTTSSTSHEGSSAVRLVGASRAAESPFRGRHTSASTRT